MHQLICSRVGGEVDFKAFKDEHASLEADPDSSLSCSPGSVPLNLHHSGGLSCNFPGFDRGCDSISSPLELSSVSTETESDEDDDLLQSLAQQFAHSMLDEETNAETLTGVCGDSGYPETRNLSNVVVNEGRLSPSSWSSGSWSSGSLLSGSRSSSKGSSRVSSQVSSPSSAPSSGYQDAWDTLYAAAGEVVRLKMNEEKKVALHTNERHSLSKVPSSNSRAQVPQARPSGQMVGRRSPHSIKRKDENLTTMNQAQQNWASKCAAMNAMASQAQPHCNQYRQHQQLYTVDGQQSVNTFYHPGKMADNNKIMQRNRQTIFNGGSGVRVVFLGGSSGREAGTGVFLPRSFEPKKKNDTSPLNAPLHGCGTGARQARTPREGVWPTLQQSMNRSVLRQPAVVHEPCLPTEWTY